MAKQEKKMLKGSFKGETLGTPNNVTSLLHYVLHVLATTKEGMREYVWLGYSGLVWQNFQDIWAWTEI